MIDRRPGPDWFQPNGIYGEAERATTRIKIRKASSLERGAICNLASNYWYFVPYVTVAVAPFMPDFLSEYAAANNCDIEVVQFKFDRQLMPQLTSHPMDTSSLLGVDAKVAESVFNFAKTVVVQSEQHKDAFRFMWEKARIISPAAGLNLPQEKLVTQMLDVWVTSVQSTTQYFFGRTAKDLRSIEFCRGERKDEILCHMIKALWSGKTRDLIITTVR